MIGRQVTTKDVKTIFNYINISTYLYDYEYQQLHAEVSKKKQIEFQFPQKNLQLRSWRTREELQIYLHKKSIELGFFQGRLYITNTHHDRERSVLKCKKCSSRIQTIQEPNKLIITLFDNVHKHSLKKHQPQFHPMLRFFQQHPFCLYLDKLTQYFNYDRLKAHKIQNLYYQKFMSLDHILDKVIVQTGVDLQTWKNRINNQIYMILMVSPTMKQVYKRFGNCIYFDMLPRLQQLRRSRHYSRYWIKIVFMGYDSNNRLALFGIGFIAHNIHLYHRNPQVYYLMLQGFFKKMDEKWPQTIITCEKSVVTKAVELLVDRKNIELVNLISWPHKLKAIKNELKEKNFSPQHIKRLMQLYSSALREIYMDCLVNFVDQIYQWVSVRLLKQNFYRHFLTLIEYENVLLRRMTKIQISSLRRKINAEAELKDLVEQLQKYVAVYRYSEALKKPFLQKKIFQKIHQNFNTNKNLISHLVSPGVYCVVTIPKLVDPHLVTFHHQHNLWICSCMYHSKIGIPCGHLLNVILNQHIKIIDYINPRYIQKYMVTPFIPPKVISRKKRRHQ